MELPHIGDQCAHNDCRQLDFLPVKCDGCKKKFCVQHWKYEGHNCATPKLKDVQVPVCPLCDKPVPSKPGANPNEAVSRHLDRDCQRDQKRNPKCSKVKCKTRELIKVDCDQCGLNFCLKHRHPQDHECSGKSTRPRTDAARAAIAIQERQNQNQSQNQNQNPNQGIAKYFQRQTAPRVNPPPTRPNAAQIQGNMSEDEALARALQESLAESQSSGATGNGNDALTQEEQDRMLALSLAQGQNQSTTTRTGTSGNGDKSCQIS